MDLGLQGKHAIVTGGSRGIGKAIARELAREGVDVAIVARNKADLEATARELGGRDEPAHPSPRRRRHQQGAGGPHGRRGGPAAGRRAHPGQQRIRARGLGHRDRPDRDGRRRGSAGGFQREVCRRAALFPRRHPVHEDGGLGPHHQHQRRQRPQRRQSQRRCTQRRPGAHDQDAGGAIGPSWDHGQLHPSRYDPHRAHAEPARRPRQANWAFRPEEAERQDFAPDSPRGNAICRMVDASEIAFVTVFLASDKAWAVSGELVAATGGAGRTVHY